MMRRENGSGKPVYDSVGSLQTARSKDLLVPANDGSKCVSGLKVSIGRSDWRMHTLDFSWQTIVQDVGPNSRASSVMRRLARCSSIICRRNSAVYRFGVLDLAMRDFLHANCKVSENAGLDQFDAHGIPSHSEQLR